MQEDKTLSQDNFFVETTGFSMHPFLKEGDKVIVKKLKAQDLKIGDIILYRDDINNKTICHRFVKRKKLEKGFILFTRGDAANILYEPVLEDDLIGRVVGIVREGKVLNLRTSQQIIINWINAKFYAYVRAAVVFLKKFRFIRLIRDYFKKMRVLKNHILHRWAPIK